MTHCMMWS